MLALCAAIWALGAAMAGAPDPSLVAGLRDLDPAVRERSADALRTAAVPELPADVRARLSAIKPGMTVDALRARITPTSTGPSAASNRGRTDTWRLDPYWTVAVVSSPDGTLLEPLTPVRDVEDVWVAPPDGFTGSWVAWFANGQKSHEIAYVGGKLDGPYRSFHPNGALAVEQHYTDGVIDGADAGFYPTGAKAYEGRYAAGAMDGTWVHWFENGTRQLEQTFHAGKETGTTSRWFEDGRLQSQVDYVDGVPHGRDRQWDANGALLWDRQH